MSLLRTFPRTSEVSNTINARPFLTFLCPALHKKISERAFSKGSVNSPLHSVHAAKRIESLYLQALVQAGTCRGHVKHISTLRQVVPHAPGHYKTRRQSTWQNPEQDGPKLNKVEVKGSRALGNVKRFAKEELEALVDYYGIKIDTRPEDDLPDDGALIWNVGDDHQPWPLRGRKDAKHVRRLEKLLEDDESPHDHVYETYKKLPSPGVVYLHIDTIRALLHHLSIVERPTPIAMQRYLSILDDMKNAHIHITRSEWTSAIYLTGRAMGTVSVDDLQSALHVWRDMEHRAGIKGGFVTLNVLFDLSVKAEKYELAETFIRELEKRRLPLHRHFRISTIYYHGIRQNGDAVRKAYQDLVNAGDIVDTVVLNAVIAALIRAGEPSAAEHVFERMKRLHATRSLPAPGHKFFTRTWRDRRAVGLHLTHEARQFRRASDNERPLKELQDYAPIAPDARTYALLIRHHSATAGNIDRVYELMQEMRYNSVSMEGAIFIAIFHGFKHFGGVRYSSWTRDKLEKIWTQYLKALRDGFDRTWISVMAVIAALKAFAKCTDPERTIRAWEEIRKMWQPNEEELENVMVILRKLVPQQNEGFFDTRPPEL
jgi:pentatricopeptide repeat protein